MSGVTTEIFSKRAFRPFIILTYLIQRLPTLFGSLLLSCARTFKEISLN